MSFGGLSAILFRVIENIDNFIAAFAESLANNTFVKATLGNYKGGDAHLQRINIRTIETKKGLRLFFLYKYDTRDTAKNYAFDEGLELIGKMLDGEFYSGHLFTTDGDLQLDIGKKGSRLNKAKPTFKSINKPAHDREKERLIDPRSPYLRALGIATDSGEIREKQHRKWTQINRFVEILSSLVEKSSLKGKPSLSIVDMGAGKGYLTFAAYDYFTNTLGLDVSVVGVEARDDLAKLSDDIARACSFEKLKFVQGTIDSYDLENVDILIALHACDTATDDALFKAISAKAELIVAAPCCHQQVRPQITPPAMLRDVLKHGVLLERTAETLTDGLRSLLLEREGYSTKMIEFVSIEHTPKNNMLVGTRLGKATDTSQIEAEIAEIKEQFGIKNQRLEQLLNKN